MEQTDIDGGKGTVTLGRDGIIHLLWNPQAKIEGADARAAMAAVNTLADGAEYPMLVDMTSAASLSRQARSVFGIRCAASRIALLGNSPVDRLLANWSMGIQNLPCPTRFFNSRTEAVSWLLPDQPKTLPDPPLDRVTGKPVPGEGSPNRRFGGITAGG